MNKYMIINNKIFKVNNVEKENNGVYIDKDKNIVPMSKITESKAYTMVDVKKDVETFQIENYKELADKYGLFIHYADKDKRPYLYYADIFGSFKFVIDVYKRKIYDVSPYSKNMLSEDYFVHDEEVIGIYENFDCDPRRVKILNIDFEIKPYEYYENINVEISEDVLIVGEYYGLTFKKSIVFVSKDDYEKILGKSKEYYAIRSGKDYEIFRDNKIEYVDYSMFKNANIYSSEYEILERYSEFINDSLIYDYENLYEINHENKTINMLIKSCERIENRKYAIFIGKNKIKRVELY